MTSHNSESEALAPCAWISVEERLPVKREEPYQVVALSKKLHGKKSTYAGQPVATIVQDWALRMWPGNFTAWFALPRTQSAPPAAQQIGGVE